MNAGTLRYTDVSLTDGQGACWNGAMTTPMMIAVASRIAASGVHAVEVLSPEAMRQCLARAEDPWQRIALLRARCPGVQLRAVVALVTEHGRHGADVIGADIAALWLKELARHGVTEVVLIDPLMQLSRMAPVLAAARAHGLAAIAALPFTPEASDDALRAQAEALAAAGASRVMLRDEAGLLTSERLAALLPALRDGLGDMALDLHLRCQTALAPLVALDAARLGIDGIDTAFAPIANGASAPALGTLLRSLGLLGIGTPASAQVLHAVRAADALLHAMADCHGWPSGPAWVFDLAPYRHQLPGASAASSMQALADAGAMHQLHAFANECAQVRRELGSPPMLAPFAQPIAQQALLHMQGMPRYAQLRPGVRRALQQAYGAAPGQVDQALLRRVGALPPAAPQVAFDDASDAALVTFHVCGVAPHAQPAAASEEPAPYHLAAPADALLAGLAARAPRYARLSVHGPDVSIELQREES